MFDIYALNDVTITGFELFMYENSDTTVEIWTKRETFIGAEYEPNKWIKVMNATAISVSDNRAVVHLQYPVRVSANSVQGFYISISGMPQQLMFLLYILLKNLPHFVFYFIFVSASTFNEDRFRLYFTPDGTVGSVVKEDTNIHIFRGIGTNDDKFNGASVSSAGFRGLFQYEYGHQCFSDSECDDNNSLTVDICFNILGSRGGSCKNEAIVGLCGNYICEPESPYLESWFTCPTDCERPDYETHAVGQNSNANTYGPKTGVMFDLETVNDDVTVFGFDCFMMNSRTNARVQVFVLRATNTSFVGKERKPAEWLKITDQILSWPSRSILKLFLDFPIRIKARLIQAVHAVFGTSNGSLGVIKGTAVGTVIDFTDHLKIMEGSWNTHSFGTFSTTYKFRAKANYFLKWSCSNNAECNDNNHVATEDKCINSECQYSIANGVCGNGICEPFNNEFCNTCPEDCIAPNDCNEMSFYSNSYGSSSAIYGTLFDVEVSRNITILELQFSMVSCGSCRVVL